VGQCDRWVRVERTLQGHDDAGFSLVELMMVVLIVAVMIAIAVPTFLGATDRARDRAVEQNVRNALTAARAAGADAAGYTDVVLSDFPISEQQFTWLDGATPSRSPVEISVGIDNPNAVVTLVALGDSGDCFMLRDWSNRAPGVEFARVDPAAGVPCSGASGSNAAVDWADAW